MKNHRKRPRKKIHISPAVKANEIGSFLSVFCGSSVHFNLKLNPSGIHSSGIVGMTRSGHGFAIARLD